MGDFEDDEWEGIPLEGENDTPPKLHDGPVPLATIADAKAEYWRIYNAYWSKEIVRDRAKTCTYMLNCLLALFKLEQDAELLRRIEQLEERIASK